VGRCFEFFAIIGLFPFLRAMQLRSWPAVGLRRTPSAGRDRWAGAALGFALLGIVALASCWAGARQLRSQQNAPQILKHILNASLAAVFASVIEELVFRGVLFGGLRKKLVFGSAAFLSSAVYALVHFFERPANPVQIDWMSGFLVFGQMLSGFVHFEKLVPGFLNLTLLGCILALAYERSKALYFSIGLHAGLIFWVKSYDFITVSGSAQSSQFWGGGKLIDGWVSTIALGFTLIAMRWFGPSNHDSIDGETPVPS